MNNPGVGKYDIATSKDKVKAKSPKCTIGNSRRPSIISITFITPGPSDYNVNFEVNKTRGPTFHI